MEMTNIAERTASLYNQRIREVFINLPDNVREGRTIMPATKTVTIQIPADMEEYLLVTDARSELCRNAMMLYPYILNQTISHGRAAEILGIRKSELIDLYDDLGYSYLDITMDDLDTELKAYRSLKGKEEYR